MTKLSDTYFLSRAGRYANSENTNDRLPIVYGNLTDGALGIWELPCIDTVNHVYSFAGHEVISVANGNSISIYENDLLLDPGLYSFDELNNYEALGNIATIDFATTKLGSTITARGKGKPTATGGATLMENIIDIVNDFLTVENDFTSSLYESTAKTMAAAIFTAQSYKAAGVIADDVPIWETIVDMMGSFLGSAYLDGNGELVFDIDINTIPLGVSDIIRKGEGYLTEAKIRRENIINQCPCNYAYNYCDWEFKGHTDDTSDADSISQDVFGVRKPETPYQFYWCRDLTSVQKVQAYIVAKLKDPLYEAEITTLGLNQVGVDIGDHVLFSADRLYGSDGLQLLNQFWKVLSVKPDYAKNKIAFRALQTAYYLTAAYLADGSYEADGSIMAGNNRDTTIY